MSNIGKKLCYPYQIELADTVEHLQSEMVGLVTNDGPLRAVYQMTEVVADGAAKHSRGDWRDKDYDCFAIKALRHLSQAMGLARVRRVLADAQQTLTVSNWSFSTPPHDIDAESNVPHMVRAATNLLMASECFEVKDIWVEPRGILVPDVSETAEPIMVYLAAPYSACPDESFRVCSEITAEAIGEGELVYSPVIYGHTAGRDGSWEYWMAHCLHMLWQCGRVVVVDSPDLGPWQDSKGVVAEIARARLWGIEVYTYNTVTKELAYLDE